MRKGTYFDVQKAFVDGKPLILEGSHIDPQEYVETDESGSLRIRVPPPEPGEREAERKMKQAMTAIDQKGAIIVVFLVRMNRADHFQCVFKRHRVEWAGESEATLRQRVERKLEEFEVV